MSKDTRSKKMKYEIYQIKNEEAMMKYGFMRLSFAKEHGLDFNDYEKVWEGQIEVEDNKEVEPINYLEHLYYEFNCNHPEGFKGHSMSVSDIVILDGVKYYCDSFGFTRI